MKTLPTLIKNTKKMMELLNIDGYKCPLFIQNWYVEDAMKVEQLYNSTKDRVTDILTCVTPFNQLRLVSTGRKKDSKETTASIYCWVERIVNSLDPLDGELNVFAQRLDGGIAEHNNPVTIQSKAKLTEADDSLKFVSACMNGKIVPTYNFEKALGNSDAKNYLTNVASLALSAYWLLLRDLNQLENHVVEVTPAKGDRELEWLEGRKHYVVLSNHQAANRGMMIGTPWGEDSHKTRIAHARRGHVRFLRSDKFKQKQGQKIFVRDAWVGPKEWKDKSLTTYKLVGV